MSEGALNVISLGLNADYCIDIVRHGILYDLFRWVQKRNNSPLTSLEENYLQFNNNAFW